MLVKLGNYFGTAFVYYCVFGLLMVVPVAICVYLVCLLKLRWAPSSRQSSVFARLLLEGDLWFCWLNPLLYLLFLYPAVWPQDRFAHGVLQGVSLIILALFWLARVTPLPTIREDWSRVWVSRIAFFAIIPHVIIAVLYIRLWWEQEILFPLSWIILSLHFAAPMVMTGLFSWGNDALVQKDFTLTGYARVRSSARGFVAVLGLSFVFSWLHRPASAADDFVVKHAAKIQQVAQANHISVRAFVGVIKAAIRWTEIWKPAFEGSIMAFWLDDAASHFGVSQSLNMSIGPAQIKATTLQMGLMIQEKCKRGNAGIYEPFASKQYRDVGRPDEYWNLDEAHCSLAQSPLAGTPGKAVIVKTLVDDTGSIEAAGFILGLYAAQWRQAGIDVSDNPEILGTLYQIGFEKSRPHSRPVANSFGKQAARIDQ